MGSNYNGLLEDVDLGVVRAIIGRIIREDL